MTKSAERGLRREVLVAAPARGPWFAEAATRRPRLEYAVEMNNLIKLEMEGAIG